MLKKFLVALLLLMLSALCAFPAAAETAQDITLDIEITSDNRDMSALYDRLYTNFWRTNEKSNPYIEFSVPEGIDAQYLYICFGDMPEAWAVQEETDGEWVTAIEGSDEFYHVVVKLNGMKHFRLIETSGKNCRMKINDLFVFSAGELPDWVQQWQPTCEKADLLVLAAHTTDEVVAIGGLLPTYAGEQKLDVVYVSMTYSNTTRRSELLNSLWSMGVRNYPIICDYYDTYTKKLEDAYSKWKKQKVQDHLITLLRQYQPDVVVTHAVNGEKGHGAHKLCADAMQYAVE